MQWAGQTTEGTKKIWLGLCGELIGEAGKVVSLKEVTAVHDAATEVGNVHAGEGVDAIGVASNVYVVELAICLIDDHDYDVDLLANLG